MRVRRHIVWKRPAIALLWLSIAVTAFGQRPAMRVYTVEDGLKYSQSFTVFQSSRGYIWIGTSYGAAIYDGNRCVTLTKANGLPHDSVHQFFEDADGKIWIMTQLGPARVDPELLSNPAACFLPVPEPLRNLPGLRGVRGPDGLWFVKYKGSKLFKFRNGQVTPVPMPFTASDHARKIISVGNDLYACSSGQVALYRNGNWKVIPVDDSADSRNITLMQFPDGPHLLTTKGLFRLEGRAFHRSRGWNLPDVAGYRVFDLLSYDQALIALTESDGFFLIEPDGKTRHYTSRNGLPSNDVTDGMIDRDGVLWLATENGVAKIFDFSVASFPASMDGIGDVYGFAEDSAGGMWVCHQKGITRYTIRNGHFEPDNDALLQKVNVPVWSALPVAGGLLAATPKGLVFASHDRLKTFPDMPLGTAMFYDLTRVRDGTIWASSLDGLIHFRWDPALRAPVSVRKYTSADGLSYDETRSITETDNGDIWIGTDGGGVMHWDGRAFHPYKQQQGLPSNVSRSVLAGPEGIWIGTDSGLFLMQDGRIEPVTTVNDKLDDLWIVSLARGANGSIWLANSFKVFEIRDRRIVRTIDKSLGLVSRNTTAESCLYEDLKGQLWVGMAGGFSIVESGGRQPRLPEPGVLIESAVRDDSTPVLPGCLLPHTANRLTFHFASPTYFAEELTSYATWLRGAEPNWSQPQKVAQRQYMNLPAGEYEFLVKAVSASGKESGRPASFKFTIGKPWWQTIYAQVFGVFALAALVLCGYSVRTRKMRRRQEELEQLVKERTEELDRAYRDLQKAHHELEQVASSDGLTGLYNRRHFDLSFDIEWRRARREGKPISLIIADVDQFKSYNDHYGHLAGDDCLKAISCLLRDCAMRPGDLAARYGGEEFVVLMPYTDAEGAALVAKTLRRRVEELRILHERSPVSRFVTISAGVYSCIPSEGQAAQEALAETDRQLYRAKREGRNRVKCSSDLLCASPEPAGTYTGSFVNS